ncbi:MAG TPA: VOC family protein [Actinomycetota bacterium]|nr:VOC family protein [Actinomycetota bacterium]
MPEFTGLAHLTLTVTDLKRSFDFYESLLGVQSLFEGEDPTSRYHVTIHPSNPFILSLRNHDDTGSDSFNETRVGMDHVALQVSNRAGMEEWEQRLEELGVDHSEIKDEYYGSVITFRDPDNIQWEFFCLPDGNATV